jgi:hypothetical protein
MKIAIVGAGAMGSVYGGLFAACPFRKFYPTWIRIVRQNHRIIESDVCNPARVRNVRR